MNRIKFKKEDYFPKKGFRKGKKVLNDEEIVSGVDLVSECVKMLKNEKRKTLILAASIRNPEQFREVSEAGADIATLPFSVIKKLFEHKKTMEGMKDFKRDSAKVYVKIARSK